MKIKKSLVEQIIKEESAKINKLIALNEEKKAILKQLNELYEEDQMDEIFGFGKKELSDEEALSKIMSHPAKKTTYEKLQKYPEIQQKYLKFVAKNPNVDYIKWDKAINDFVDSSQYSDVSGILGTRKW